MPSILIKNATTIAGSTTDLLIQDGRIAACETSLTAAADHTIDATGLLLTPGLIDTHVHLREPGREDKETISTGTASAVKGGVTSVLAMANTNPPIADQSTVEFVKARARETAYCNVFVSGNATKNAEGKELAELWEMKNCGVRVIADDASLPANKDLTYRILDYCATHGLIFHSHVEKLPEGEHQSLAEGPVAARLGLKGTPDSSESAEVAQLLEMLVDTPCRLHITQVTTRRTVELIRDAKRRGLPVTADTQPHYLLLTDEAAEGYNTHAKVFPPVRSEDHRQALIEGVKDGTIDLLASDHAPHTLVEKYVEFERAAVGMVGLETLFPILYTGLVETGILTLSHLIDLLTVRPAQLLLGEDLGTLTVGAPADITLWDTTTTFTIDPNTFASKARNCPWTGRQVRGKAQYTIVGGVLRVAQGELLPPLLRSGSQSQKFHP